MARIRDVKGQTELMDYMHVVTAPRLDVLEKENAALRDLARGIMAYLPLSPWTDRSRELYRQAVALIDRHE